MLPFRALSPLLLTLVVAASGCTRDESYPNHPITLVCPWAKGGGTDGLSRQMAVLLERELGVAVNVENQTGGEGVTGHSAGAQARPDGYTLMMMTVELNMLHWRDLTSIRHRDFRTLMVLNRDAAALLVRSDAPWQSIGDLASEIKSRPGELKGSGTAKGGIWHLAFAGWLHAIGQSPTDVNWIPTRGAGPSLQELIAEKDRGLDLVCCSLPEAQPLMASGRVRALGVMAAERLAEFPDVPTFVEQGVDWSLGGWRALGVPAATPERIVERLLGALRKIVAGDEFLGFMRHRGFVIAVEEGDVEIANRDGCRAGQAAEEPGVHRAGHIAVRSLLLPGSAGRLARRHADRSRREANTRSRRALRFRLRRALAVGLCTSRRTRLALSPADRRRRRVRPARQVARLPDLRRGDRLPVARSSRQPPARQRDGDRRAHPARVPALREGAARAAASRDPVVVTP